MAQPFSPFSPLCVFEMAIAKVLRYGLNVELLQ
jgi:hypothetical protein